MAQTIREMLDSRESEVRRLIDDIREKQLAPLERELGEIVIARAAIIGRPNNADLFAVPVTDESARFMRMTHVELVKQAFIDEFEMGATIAELLVYIRDKYGREIGQGSLSPVLTRMGQSGLLQKMGKVWLPSLTKIKDEYNGL